MCFSVKAEPAVGAVLLPVAVLLLREVNRGREFHVEAFASLWCIYATAVSALVLLHVVRRRRLSDPRPGAR